MNTKRILITCTALAALGLALAASQNGVAETLTTRIDNAIHDLEKVHAPIPHAALHNRALEILRSRPLTVAKDDEPNIDPCIAFTKTTMQKTTCK